MERIWRIIGERWKRRNDFYLALFYPCHLSYFTFIQSIHRSTDKLPIMIHWLLSEIFRKFLWLIIIETPYPLPNSPKSPLPYPLNNLKFLQSNKNSSLPRIKRPISAWWPPLPRWTVRSNQQRNVSITIPSTLRCRGPTKSSNPKSPPQHPREGNACWKLKAMIVGGQVERLEDDASSRSCPCPALKTWTKRGKKEANPAWDTEWAFRFLVHASELVWRILYRNPNRLR